ncbi:dual oxidase 2-like [Anoplophora glabripennis]|uniref:dual oxidase 2-like n=1 Tax=Anoplophora glabripennis TaxID=217634 RepID=UPI000873B876|nr:dual oxidase 2-like [Anoplophora glabripennis]
MQLTVLTFLLLIFGVSIKAQVPNTNKTVNPPPSPPPPNHKEKPSGEHWPGLYKDKDKIRNRLADWLLNGNWGNDSAPPKERHYEYEGYDGFYNNIAVPDLGAIDKPLLRRWPAAYKDGSYEPSGYDRPNPIELSDQLLNGDIGQMSQKGRNALFLFFGQQVVEEILDAQRPACPPEYFNIKIPEKHKYRKYHTEMPVLRTRYDMRTGYSPNNPRQQLNEITPYFDGGLFYGTTKLWSDQLRTYQNGSMDQYGLLASSENELFPEYNTHRLPMANPPPPIYHAHYTKMHETAKVNRFFKLGNPRGNENAFLLSFGIMWFRWHNYLAKRIRHHHPKWSSEKIYNEARKWVIATQQNIVMYEWLPVLLSISKNAYNYDKYDPSVDPQIDQFFQSAAFRFGHTLVVPGVYLRDYIRNGCKTRFNSWNKPAVRTCNIFWRPQEPILNRTEEKEFLDIDRLLMGMSVQLTEKEDHVIVPDLRGNVFGPLEFPRRDLMAINIQRGRDHGLPDFNSARKAFGLKPYTDFNNFSVSNEIKTKLMSLYKNNINNIDPWIGGILETRDGPGELFAKVIFDQFIRIRDGDRFWFENTQNELFTTDEIQRIKDLTIYDVLMAVTKMDANDIPKFAFRAPKINDSDLIAKCSLTKFTTKGSDGEFYHLQQLNEALLKENCTEPGTYDYMNNSEISYIFTFIGIGTFVIGTAGVVYLLIKLKEKNIGKLNARNLENQRYSLKNEKRTRYPHFVVNEWIGKKYPLRKVVVILKQDNKQICVTCYDGKVLRALDFTHGKSKMKIVNVTDEPTLVIQCIHNYDLVLKFETDYLRDHFLKEFNESFIGEVLETETINLNWNSALKIILTKDDRQKRLEMFFRVVFAQAFKIKHSKNEILRVDAYVAKEVIDTELTICEFADSLSMSSNNEFVKRMFSLIDKDKNGFISFREFVDLLIIFANGDEEQKAKLLFDMYDIDSTGELKQEDFVTMIKSFLETVGGKVDDEDIHKTVNHMLEQAGIAHKKNNLTFEDFKKMIGEDIKNLNTAKLGFKGIKKQDRGSFLQDAKTTIENIYQSHQEIQARFEGQSSTENGGDTNESRIIDERQEELIRIQDRSTTTGRIHAILRFIELKSKEIFWMTLYTFILLAIFAERAYYYTVEREHSGLRRIAGYGVTITRGAASAMMFTYSSLLVTMCRNTITYLRDTVVNNYFPFDASVEFHKYIALWAFAFTIIHIVGHAFNFYHISTQTADDLTCLFRNYFHSTHELPKFHYWCWQTMTGLTGVLVTLVFCVMYMFTLPIIRRKIYNWFWYTHNLYPVFFILLILHGTGRLIQPPFTYYFLLGPLILFTLDTLISVSRKKIEIPVIHAEILPSNVTKLEFQKPENFQYKAGQWVRIACLELNRSEYHPFTLSSAPNEETLTLHIRAVGPWTMHIRSIYDNSTTNDTKLPKIYLDGPYGEGHQDWNTYDIAILIGGGIGVTPFASILKDVSYSANKLRTRCKKVYFIWVSRTQKQFEWLVDIIRDVESKDTKNFVSCHIFITQFYEKFDLRTILLYICERHYQRVANKSLFTNLRAVTHFGRPEFSQFFRTVQYIHESAQRIGVFSCGPPSMTTAVDHACSQINLQTEQRFEHHFKNF